MKRAVVVVAVCLSIGVGSAAAAPGAPPANLSPVAASMYRAQFALCSLDTLGGLAGKLNVGITGLSPVRAAGRLASANERSIGRAAVLGCQHGLLYRFNTEQKISGLRRSFRSRVTAEKYVAAAYLLVVAVFFGYVLVHAAKISRLTRSVETLSNALRDLHDADGVATSDRA